ncbi:MAG: hypothetical protein OCD02_06365 [Spirochaetaceae bacterium]
MKKYILRKIRNINSIIIFVCLILTSIFLLKELISSIIPSKPRGVEIVEIDDSDSKIEQNYNVIRKLDNIITYEVSSEKIVKRTSGGFDRLAIGSKYIGRGTPSVNMFFYSIDTQKGHYLFQEDLLIKHYELSRENREKGFNFNKNIYLIISDDTNQNTFLTADDRTDLYISNKYGENVIKLAEDVINYTLVDNNQITFNTNETKIHYLYDSITEEVTKLFEVK